MNKGVGQYDLEYLNCPCFWGTQPGKFVKYIPDLLLTGKVLDLGAGEGKNSIYLADIGFDVTAVEVSEAALNNFRLQVDKLESKAKSKLQLIHKDVLDFDSVVSYDVVIAYGLLHCLASIEDVDFIIEKIKKWTRENGIIVIVSFNDKLPIPNVQTYLEPTLLPVDYLIKAFSDFEILKYEDDIITETHPTSNIEHQHSLTRIIARNNGPINQ